MALTLPAFTVGRKVRASELAQLVTALNALTPLYAIKATDEFVSSATTGTTLHNDTALFLPVAANTKYKIDMALVMVESAGSGIDVKAAWTQPSGSRLDAAVASPHVNWTSPAGSANEIEWAAWQNETGTTTSTKQWGSNSAVFSYHVHGLLQVGANAGTLQFQWAQLNSSANTLYVKAGSLLTLTQLP